MAADASSRANPRPKEPRPVVASGGHGGASTRLLVVRHGQSEWNALGRWQGHADVALDRTGELQAAEAAEVLGAFDAIWSSDLQRAHRTAQIIAVMGGFGPVRTDVRLRETDVGPWEGLTHQEVERDWPGFLAERRRPEGFEPYADAAARMIEALLEIAADLGGATGGRATGSEGLVVSHGGVIRAARRALGAESPHLPNLSGSWFEVRDGRLVAGETVHLLVEEQDVSEVL